MAISNDSSPLGQFSGSIGPYVLYLWKGRQCAKSKPEKTNKRAKPKGEQRKQNNIFRAVQQFLTVFKKVIQIGYQMPKNADMSGFNAAMSYHMEHAVLQQGKVKYLDLTKVKFSKRINQLQALWNLQSSVDAEANLTFNWELNPFPYKDTRLDDRVMLVFYAKDNNQLFTPPYAVLREELTYTLKHNMFDCGGEIYCYLFLYSADKKRISETQFLGVLNVKAQTWQTL